MARDWDRAKGAPSGPRCCPRVQFLAIAPKAATKTMHIDEFAIARCSGIRSTTCCRGTATTPPPIPSRPLLRPTGTAISPAFQPPTWSSGGVTRSVFCLPRQIAQQVVGQHVQQERPEQPAQPDRSLARKDRQVADVHPGYRAQDGDRDEHLEGRPEHRPGLEVLVGTGAADEDVDDHRDGLVEVLALGAVSAGKEEQQGGDHHDAAADAQQAAKDPRDTANRRQHEHLKARHRHATPCSHKACQASPHRLQHQHRSAAYKMPCGTGSLQPGR